MALSFLNVRSKGKEIEHLRSLLFWGVLDWERRKKTAIDGVGNAVNDRKYCES
jgi:hypothetical protein